MVSVYTNIVRIICDVAQVARSAIIPHLPGEDGRDVVTAIIVDPSTPELGRPVELRCSISQSSLGLAQRNGSKLTWNERGGTKRTAEIYNRTTGEAVLRISNFSIADYGVYTCHCVNEYTFLQYETCGGHEGLPTHCSTPLEVELLPSSGMTYSEEFALETL